MSKCPCCGAKIKVPTFENLVVRAEISEMQARILKPVWRAKGEYIPTERLIDFLYADDPDGGPLNARGSFQIILRQLRAKLAPFGVKIKSRYSVGYRLVMEKVK